MSLSTAPQRRFIEWLATGMTDDDFVEAIRRAGHTGRSAEGVFGDTRNRMLKRLSRRQASKMIEHLKTRPRPATHYLRVEEPEPLAPVTVEVPPELRNA